MKFFTQVLSFLLSVLVAAQASNLNTVLGLSAAVSTRQCGSRTPCMWAVCRWRAALRVDETFCNFLDYGCQCREGTSCQQTGNIKPGPSNYLTYSFYCLPNGSGNQN
ncbi:uncharacterized protein [Haliotis asinina]|uniref:uncharacterized protein n=1 Tax=Haliotis asinina TaxID=109174 RepID=UPI0035319DD9